MNDTLLPGALPPHPLADKIHIYLVEPEHSLNIGSVARAMMNFGFYHLHLVNPHEFDKKKAIITARWASGLVENAQIHSDFQEAIAPMHEVIGFGGRKNFNATSNLLLPEWITNHAPLPSINTALVFGPEDTGLRNEHIQFCRWLVRIPSNAEFPSFNLAQAVLLVLYEFSRSLWPQVTALDTIELPDWKQYQALDRIVDNVLTASGFYRQGSPETTPPLVKNLLRRMNADDREMRVMLALFSRIQKTLEISLARSAKDPTNLGKDPAS